MRVGIVGWRGMVGSVLIERMRAERDFELASPVFFSTTRAGTAAPDVGRWAEQVSGLEVVGRNPEHRWEVRVHARATMHYRAEILVLRRRP